MCYETIGISTLPNIVNKHICNTGRVPIAAVCVCRAIVFATLLIIDFLKCWASLCYGNYVISTLKHLIKNKNMKHWFGICSSVLFQQVHLMSGRWFIWEYVGHSCAYEGCDEHFAEPCKEKHLRHWWAYLLLRSALEAFNLATCHSVLM